MNPWVVTHKYDPRGAALADRHYSRRTIGSPQFMPPGETLVLVTEDGRAVFGWRRPHPASGLRAMNGLDGWTCTIFRSEYEERGRASGLILAAEQRLLQSGRSIGPDGMLTYVFDRKVRSSNPGCCFKKAGWLAGSRSQRGRKEDPPR